MKKLLCLLLGAMILSGCNRAEETQLQEQLKLYETFYRSLLNEDRFQTSSRFFSITTDIDVSEDGYQYLIVIDDARIAMYDVQVMVVENQRPFNLDVMMPSAGIFDSSYTFIPHQSREEKNFMRGIAVGRLDLEEDQVSVRVLVSWKNYSKLESFKEVFEFDIQVAEPELEESETEG